MGATRRTSDNQFVQSGRAGPVSGSTDWQERFSYVTSYSTPNSRIAMTNDRGATSREETTERNEETKETGKKKTAYMQS